MSLVYSSKDILISILLSLFESFLSNIFQCYVIGLFIEMMLPIGSIRHCLTMNFY